MTIAHGDNRSLELKRITKTVAEILATTDVGMVAVFSSRQFDTKKFTPTIRTAISTYASSNKRERFSVTEVDGEIHATRVR